LATVAHEARPLVNERNVHVHVVVAVKVDVHVNVQSR
jgi:hypothetical protein